VLLYALLAGRQPFDGDSHVVVQQVTSEDPPSPSEANPDLPDGVDAVVERAMAKRKPERYETVEDLQVGVERLLDEHAPELR
jgi:serine/threonine-protein kinase